MDKEQILDWLGHPVTLLYIDIIKERLSDLQESDRYSPMIAIGDRLIPATSDYIAMQQASLQGQKEILEEVSNLKEMLIDED